MYFLLNYVFPFLAFLFQFVFYLHPDKGLGYLCPVFRYPVLTPSNNLCTVLQEGRLCRAP